MQINKCLLSILCCLFFFTTLQAKVWRVNNNDDSANFNDIDVAHNSSAVVNGDTLYVEGSRTRYSSLTCTKRLTIIGPGYFLEDNKLSAHFFSARTSTFTFNNGSEGSKVIGMVFDQNSSSSANSNTNNITIERCYMRGSVTLGNTEGIRIIGNYLRGFLGRNSSTTFDEVYFNNNIVTGSISNSDTENIITLNNNILLGSSFSFRAFQVHNNILIDGTATININSTNVEKNISTNNIFGENNINVNNIDALFVGGESPDGKYQLAENSAAKNSGVGGVDIGIFGGDDPYVISGLPPIPIISILELDDAASVETGLKVKIKITSN